MQIRTRTAGAIETGGAWTSAVCRAAWDDRDKACEVGTRCAQGRCWWPVLTRGRVDGRDMVVVPGGNFLMGTESADGVSDELPAHLVEIEAFSIDRFEVTAGEFQACIDAGGCKAGSAKTVAEWDECTLGDPLRKDLPMTASVGTAQTTTAAGLVSGCPMRPSGSAPLAAAMVAPFLGVMPCPPATPLAPTAAAAPAAARACPAPWEPRG